MFAFLPSLGWQEMFLLIVIGLLLYGRNLPEAGRNLGRMAGQLKRGFDEFKRQLNEDADLREMKRTIDATADEVRRARSLPQAVRDPVHAAKTFARDALAAPVEPERTDDAAAQPEAGAKEEGSRG